LYEVGEQQQDCAKYQCLHDYKHRSFHTPWTEPKLVRKPSNLNFVVRTYFNGNPDDPTGLEKVEEEYDRYNTTMELDHSMDEVAVGLLLYRQQNRLFGIDLTVAILTLAMVIISLIEVNIFSSNNQINSAATLTLLRAMIL
jgi:hypothetical protein